MSHMFKKPSRQSATLDFDLEGELCQATVRWNKQAKRLIMRVDPRSGEVAITLPKRVSLKEAQKFIAERTGWIKEQRSSIVIAPPIACGQTLDFKGVSHQLVFTDVAPRSVRLGDGVIEIGGPSGHAPARLQRWLKKQAREALTESVERHVGTLGLVYNSIAVADTKSRWGSCSSKKNLRFSWRLVLARPEILNYVAAHEVAHLVEMNHSKAFWAQVERCDSNWKTHRKWLKQEGHMLFAMANV